MATNPAFFRDLAYVFLAAFAGGLLAWRLRLPVIIGYILAGVLISPFTPGPSVTDVHTLELFAEIGVILLMFSIGLEFSVKELMRARWVALLGGPIGIVLSIGMGFATGRLLGWTDGQGLVVGAIVSVASTMVLIRLLADRGELRTESGRVMVAITLVEDLAVVILVVLLPALGNLGSSQFWGLTRALGYAAAILIPALFVAAKVVPPLLTRVARAQRRDLFFMLVLAICLGTAALTQAAGLSLALGAFVAGLIISDSEYTHETLAELFPLRESFVALFFVTVGFLIQPGMLISNIPLVATMITLIVFGKFAIWTAVVWVFRYPVWMALSVAIGLTQIGEFSFILVQTARKAGIVGSEVYNATLAASLLSILLNVALVRYVPASLHRWRLAKQTAVHSEQDLSGDELRGHVLLCGFGRVGSAIGAALETFRVPYVVIEINPDIKSMLKGRGIPSIFGNAAHLDILHRAGADKASLAIITIPDIDRSRLAVAGIRRLNLNIPILGRAHRASDHAILGEAGANEVVQPEMEASATIIRHAASYLRLPDEQVRAYLRAFREALDSFEFGHVRSQTVFPELREMDLLASPLVGGSLGRYQIRTRFGVTVISVTRSSGTMIVNPPSDLTFEPGDTIRVIGLPDKIEELRSQLIAPKK
jgi:K+:H+ antiporter